MLSDRYKFDGESLLKLNTVQKKVKNRINNKIKTGEYSFEKVKCVVCEGNNFEKLSEKDRYGLYMPVVICRDCGLIQTNPRMNETSYGNFYSTEYRKLYEGKNKPSDSVFKKQYQRGRQIYYFLKKLALLKKLGKNPLILEVGCGAGGVLNYFKEKSYMVKGIDLDDDYLKYGQANYNLDLSRGTIHETPFNKPSNLVIYAHVFEHILDLKKELAQIKNILHRSGIIYIEVPGVKNLVTNYEMDFLRYLQNAHTYHFSLTTLRNLMLNNGFELVYGNEKIQSVWRKSNQLKSQINNDFSSEVKYLNNLERYRKVVPTSLIRIVGLSKVLLLNTLKKLRLYNVSKKLYNGLRYRNF